MQDIHLESKTDCVALFLLFLGGCFLGGGGVLLFLGGGGAVGILLDWTSDQDFYFYLVIILKLSCPILIYMLR